MVLILVNSTKAKAHLNGPIRLAALMIIPIQQVYFHTKYLYRLDDALVHSMLLRQFCEQLVPVGVQFCLSQYRHGGDANLLLEQLPLGYLRLSADFAHQPLAQDVRDEMREVIERAHRLGLQVIGQAVEDPQAAAALWMGGIDFIQGNLVQRAEHALDFDFKNATL